VEWQEKIRDIAEADGRKEAEVVRECEQTISLRDWPSGGEGGGS